MGYTKGATAFINRDALTYNLNKIKGLAPDSKILAIVKANGYGHGGAEVARQVEFVADGFGVARLGEAIELRKAGVVKPILLLEGFYARHDLPVLVEYKLQTVVHCEEQIEALEQEKLQKPVTVWLKIDSGMHRLGVRPESVDSFITRLNACKNVLKPLHFASHFARADELECEATTRQIELFLSLTDGCSGKRSIAASAGILAWPDSRLDWNRPGLIMYGISPFCHQTAQELGYRPAMTMKAPLIAVREVKAAESVGYGAIWTSERDTRVGVIAIGYGDGYPRTAPNGTPVWVNGRKVPLVGRVSMDMLTVDLGPDATDKVGDEVILWGEELPVEEIANHVGTIPYELVTRLTSRVDMVYLTDEG